MQEKFTRYFWHWWLFSNV